MAGRGRFNQELRRLQNRAFCPLLGTPLLFAQLHTCSFPSSLERRGERRSASISPSRACARNQNTGHFTSRCRVCGAEDVGLAKFILLSEVVAPLRGPADVFCPATTVRQPSRAFPMPLLLAAITLLLALGAASPPHQEGPPLPAPREVARTAVGTYNQQSTGTSAVFRLLKIRSTQKTRFGWGVHFSMNFTIKETTCRKTSSYRIGSCKYKPRGLIKDCSAEVSILNLVDDTPLTSVQCKQRGKSPSSMNANAEMASPVVHVEHYFPSSYSTAALTAIEGE